ncbi:MAG: ATP-binding protein [Thermoflavifilum aggregans]|nr:ATP-binding protein [Thermoflavifilum aggregans]
MKISLLPHDTDDLNQILNEYIRLLTLFNKVQDQTHIFLSFENIHFVNPLLALFLSASIGKAKQAQCKVELIGLNDEGLRNYLNTIYFSEGFQARNEDECLIFLKSYGSKTFLPILHFPASDNDFQTNIRDLMISALIELMKAELRLDYSYQNLYSYLIYEMVDNIVEHAQVEAGWLFAQYYKQKAYLDLCILDTGVTILGSYQRFGVTGIYKHSDAIRKAIEEGCSTKLESGRGHGLSDSFRKIKQLQGDLILISGDGLLHNNFLYLDLPASWQGTIVFFRIPMQQKFDFYKLTYL